MRALAALVLALVVACSASPAISPRDCTPGTTSACACPGALGVQTCGADGTLGACVCADAGGASDVPPATTDVPSAVDVVDGSAPGLDVTALPDRPQGADAADIGAPAADVVQDAPLDAVDAWRPVVCGSGRFLCAGRCVDLADDVENCGACGNACPAGRFCVGGACTVLCPTGRTACGLSCVDLASDPSNCGACGTQCPSRNSTAFCRGRACGQDCMQGFADCDSNRENGCETPTATDRVNCGACGRTCGNTEQCVAGACVPGCAGGCGSGGVCNAGACVMCPSGRVACANTCRDLLTDRANCGACGAACPQPAGATVACVNGGCALTACADPMYRDCDGSAANGCETLIVADRNNCGACGVRCGDRQACTAGRCACQTSSDLMCNGACVPVGPDHCGACGRACASNEFCGLVNGTGGTVPGCISCGIERPEQMLRRCENRCVDLNSDDRNCGACGVVCTGSRACFSGVCR